MEPIQKIEDLKPGMDIHYENTSYQHDYSSGPDEFGDVPVIDVTVEKDYTVLATDLSKGEALLLDKEDLSSSWKRIDSNFYFAAEMRQNEEIHLNPDRGELPRDPDANPLYHASERTEAFIEAIFEKNPEPDFSKLEFIQDLNNSLAAGTRISPENYLNEFTVVTNGETTYQIRNYFFDSSQPIENGTEWPGAPTMLQFAAITCPHSDMTISHAELIEKINQGEFKIENNHSKHYFSSQEQYDTVQTVMNPARYATDQERAMANVLYRKETGMEFFPQAKEFLLEKFGVEHPQETTMVLQLMNDKNAGKTISEFLEKNQVQNLSQQQVQPEKNISNNSKQQMS